MDQVSDPQAHYVYMVCCANGTLYTGYTINVERRIALHNAGKGARYTRSHRPVTLVATWTFNTKGEALRAERELKHLPREQKLRVAEQAIFLEGEGS
jgi:putative endonuclease